MRLNERPAELADGRVESAPQELVMTILGAYVSPRETCAVWAGGLVALLGELGFTEGAARIALSRLVRRDLLARSKQGRQVLYTLTRRARGVLAEGDRRIFTFGRSPVSGQEWTLLWHSTPDDLRKEREALVRRLRFLGFGPIQDGTWVVPRDAAGEVDELLRELGLRAHAGLMSARPSGPDDMRSMAARAWDLDGLARAYASFIAEFTVAEVQDDRHAFALRTRLVHGFRQFPALDPELPDDYGALGDRRAEAVQLFHDQYSALAPSAQRHFDEVTRA